MKRKMKLKKLKKEIQKLKSDNSISINKFLIRFFGIPLGKLKISHEDISIMMPNLEKIDIEEILKNKDLIYKGEVILIIDSYGHTACYITPDIQNDCPNKGLVTAHTNNDKDLKFEIVALSEDLSRYKLALLTKYYKNKKDFNRYRVARDFLKIKKDEESTERYKNKKLELKMKGREEID